METIFRTLEPESTDTSEHRDVSRQPKDEGVVNGANLADSEPVTDTPLAVLESLGVNDDPSVMPFDEYEHLEAVADYVKSVAETKGVGLTRGNFSRVMNDIKAEMGLSADTEPSIALDRIAGVVNAWKELSFIKDPSEKRSIFMRLAKQKDSKEMNRVVLEIMNGKEVWL